MTELLRAKISAPEDSKSSSETNRSYPLIQISLDGAKRAEAATIMNPAASITPELVTMEPGKQTDSACLDKTIETEEDSAVEDSA